MLHYSYKCLSLFCIWFLKWRARSFTLCCLQKSYEAVLDQSWYSRTRVSGLWVSAVVNEDRSRSQFSLWSEVGAGPVSSWCSNSSEVNTWCDGGDAVVAPSLCHVYPFILTSVPSLVSLKAQWEPKLLEPPAHTHINYVVTNLNGGPKPPAPVEDSYRKMILTVSRCV